MSHSNEPTVVKIVPGKVNFSTVDEVVIYTLIHTSCVYKSLKLGVSSMPNL